ncbi:hypothetical protein SDC9_138534 [bioreactor metagenome]|uniref:Uncharacterized protein n=1 Tax=bioreactor metagenome TaxID=1076179 RepID=A0A645DQ66_9ZZZZ
MAQRGAGKGDGDPVGQPAGDLVGQPGDGVLLMDDDRHPQLPGRQVGGHRHVAAEADHDIGGVVLQDVPGLVDGAPQSVRDLGEIDGEPARERDRVDELEIETGRRHHPGLEPLGGADGHQPHPGLAFAEPVGGGDQRRGVAGGAAPGEHDIGHLVLPVPF